MGLKNLLRRASGLITAFALLALMVVPVSVAGAFYVGKTKITVDCHNCSAPDTTLRSDGSIHSHVFLREYLTPVSVNRMLQIVAIQKGRYNGS